MKIKLFYLLLSCMVIEPLVATKYLNLDAQLFDEDAMRAQILKRAQSKERRDVIREERTKWKSGDFRDCDDYVALARHSNDHYSDEEMKRDHPQLACYTNWPEIIGLARDKTNRSGVVLRGLPTQYIIYYAWQENRKKTFYRPVKNPRQYLKINNLLN